MVSPAVMAGETSAPGTQHPHHPIRRSDNSCRRNPPPQRRDASGHAQQNGPCAHAHIHVCPQGQRRKSPSVPRKFPVSNARFSHGEIARKPCRSLPAGPHPVSSAARSAIRYSPITGRQKYTPRDRAVTGQRRTTQVPQNSRKPGPKEPRGQRRAAQNPNPHREQTPMGDADRAGG